MSSSERTKLLSPAAKVAAGSAPTTGAAKVAAGGQPAAAAHHGHGHHGDVAKPVSAIAIALLCFSAQAGGPFGIESAVKAAGALPTIIGLFVAGGLWALPQAFITAELAAAIPANGGPVVWTRRAWGTKTSFVVSMLLVSNQIVDLGLYPALVAAYFQQLFPAAVTGWVVYAIKLASLVLTVALNILGVDALSAAAAVLTVVILTPFVVLPIVAAARGMSFDWSALGPGGIPAEAPSKAALFMTTVLWSMQGWGEIGLLAGEIQSPEKVLPPGLLIAAFTVVLAYITPVAFGVALRPNLDLWDDGFLVDLADDVAPWLAAFVLVSAALASMSTFLLSMATYSRTLQAAAREGMIPVPLLGRNMTRWRTPLPAIGLLALTTIPLMMLNFDDIVVVDSCFYVLATMVIVAGFLRLRYTEPRLPRPYRFPLGLPGAWAAVILTEIIAVASIYFVSDGDPISAATIGGTLVLLTAVSFAWERWCSTRGFSQLLPAVSADEEEAAAAARAGDSAGIAAGGWRFARDDAGWSFRDHDDSSDEGDGAPHLGVVRAPGGGLTYSPDVRMSIGRLRAASILDVEARLELMAGLLGGGGSSSGRAAEGSRSRSFGSMRDGRGAAPVDAGKRPGSVLFGAGAGTRGRSFSGIPEAEEGEEALATPSSSSQLGTVVDADSTSRRSSDDTGGSSVDTDTGPWR